MKEKYRGSYALDKDKNPYPVEHTEVDWSVESRRVAKTTLADGTVISTVFLVLDHGFHPDEKPVLFETMVFPSEHSSSDQECNRYHTWKEAVEGHKEMVKRWRKKK